MRQFLIPTIPDADVLIETALSRGSKRAGAIGKHGDRLQRAKDSEIARVQTIQDTLVTALEKTHDAFPNFDTISEFLRNLFLLDMDVGKTKQALGGIHHAVLTLKGIGREHTFAMRHASVGEKVLASRRSCLGRMVSVLRQTKRHLEVLRDARLALLALPKIDDELFTVAIAGFPNVGKSTLLSKLTEAKPEIKAYAFTTKGLNVGFFEYKYNKIQCIDTPGTLDREQSNAIEKKAEIALRYLAHVVIYVVDPLEAYPLEKQRALYERTLELDKPTFVYISKTDIADKKKVASLLTQYPGAHTDIALMRKALMKEFKAWA